ncbi:MAG: hypothetical protein COA78_29005 [Blastopirellula sp.]|nr:MAG: hypothetical protein COA78_29005 [Blastopirellula sp.]
MISVFSRQIRFCLFAFLVLNGAVLSAARSELPEIAPPPMAADTQEINLPGLVSDVDVGGGGRYIGLYFKTLRKIGILDVNTLKISGYLPANDDDTKFALGAFKAIVVGGDRGVISRYDLKTLERELTQSIDIGNKINHVLLGSASSGPAIIGGGGRHSGTSGGAYTLDLETLKKAPMSGLGRNLRHEFEESTQYRISANGNVLSSWYRSYSPTGLHTIVKSGDTWITHYEHDSVGYILPSPDGKRIFTARGLFNNELTRVGEPYNTTNQYQYSIPAVHGPYYLTIKDNSREKEVEDALYLKLMGDNRPLITIKHLENFTSSDDRYSKKVLTPEKRLFLIPDANLILHLQDSGDKLIAAKLDIDQALKGSKYNYLITTSRPPLEVNVGDTLNYQIKAKSKSEISFTLAAGAPGMTLSSAGLLSWKPSAQSPKKNEIIVSLENKTGEQTFQTFTLNVQGGSDQVQAITTTTNSSSPKSVTTKRSDFPGESMEIRLPGTLSDVVVGGSGRYLFLHIKDLKKIAVFDVNQTQIVKYLPASDNNTMVVAGATRALVFSLTAGVVTRYRLDTLTADLTITIPFSNSINYLGMGSGSEGPVLLRTSTGTSALDRCTLEFMDINTMKPMKVEWPNGRQPHMSFRDYNPIRVSTNGEAYYVLKIGVLKLIGNKVEQMYPEYHDVIPSADAKYFIAGNKVLNSALKPTGNSSVAAQMTIPSVTGNYFFKLEGDKSIRFGAPQVKKMLNAKVYMFGDDRPLLTTPIPLESTQRSLSAYGRVLGFDKRFFYMPDASLIVTIPFSNDTIRVKKFDIDHALEESGVDYLLVASQAPSTAKIGEEYDYTVEVKSKKGGVEFSLESAPEGMKMSSTGKISWKVPADIEESTQNIIVSVKDLSGQTAFHAFKIAIPEIEERLIKAKEIADKERIAAELKARQEALKQRALAMENMRKEQEKRRLQIAKATNSSSNSNVQKIRIWKDNTETHELKASFIEIKDKSIVVLKLESGELRQVPISRLSNQDIYEAVRLDLLRVQTPVVETIEMSPFKPIEK